MVEFHPELEDLGHSKSAEDWEQAEHNEQKNNDLQQYPKRVS
jgi:hypothetical protein